MHAPQPSKPNRWMILLAIVIIVSIVGITLSYVISQKKTDETASTPAQPAAQAITAVAKPSIQPVATTISNDVATPSNAIVDSALLNAPLPQDEALAREEMDRLKDQQSQLMEQKALLQQQLKDSNQLIELKEKLLADMQSQLDKTAV